MSVADSIGHNHHADKVVAGKLGKGLEIADSEYREAIKSGDEEMIAVKKLERDKAEQRFMAFMSSKDKEHDIIMQLINMIRN